MATTGRVIARPSLESAITVPRRRVSAVGEIHGAGQAWAVINECYEAPSDCDKILAEVNGDGDGVKFFEDGSAYLEKNEHKYK